MLFISKELTQCFNISVPKANMTSSDLERKFVEAAQRMVVPPELEWPWTLFLRAIDAGWIDRDDLIDMVDALKKDDFGGYRLEKFYVEPQWGMEGELKTGFLDDYCVCRKNILIEFLKKLVNIILAH
jgi:hypothetical protein